MSMRALLLAVRDQHRKPISEGGLGYDDNSCETTLQGKPPAIAGDVFIGVHRGNVIQEKDLSDYRLYAVKVTVSMRMKSVPFDRIGPALLEDDTNGIDDIVDAIIAMMVNQQYDVMNAANALIKGTPEWCNIHTGVPSHNGFLEPLRLLGVDDEPQLRSGAWWQAQPDEPNAGVTLSIRFGTGRRIQVLGSIS